MPRLGPMGANGLERVHDLGIADGLPGACGKQDVVHRDDTQHRAAEACNGRPPHAMLLHRCERGVHVVVGATGVDRRLGHLAGSESQTPGRSAWPAR